MTVSISNVALTNTFDFWRTITNQLADAMSTKVITTNANVATGNAIINGYFTANGITANSITINGGSGVVNVASGNVTANLIVGGVGTFANITVTNTATINIASVTTYTGNLMTVNTGSFVSFSGNTLSVNNATISNLNSAAANLTIASGTNATFVNIMANVAYANTLKVGNTSANVTVLAPNTTQANGSYYLNGNGAWSLVSIPAGVAGSNTQVQYNGNGALSSSAAFIFNYASNTLSLSNAVSAAIVAVGNNQQQQITLTTSGASSQQIDSFLIANFRGAEYTIQCSNTSTNSFHLAKLLVLHNGGSVLTTEYGTIYTNTNFATYTTSINATAVSVNVTPTLTTTTVNIQRTLLSI